MEKRLGWYSCFRCVSASRHCNDSIATPFVQCLSRISGRLDFYRECAERAGSDLQAFGMESVALGPFPLELWRWWTEVLLFRGLGVWEGLWRVQRESKTTTLQCHLLLSTDGGPLI